MNTIESVISDIDNEVNVVAVACEITRSLSYNSGGGFTCPVGEIRKRPPESRNIVFSVCGCAKIDAHCPIRVYAGDVSMLEELCAGKLRCWVVWSGAVMSRIKDAARTCLCQGAHYGIDVETARAACHIACVSCSRCIAANNGCIRRTAECWDAFVAAAKSEIASKYAEAGNVEI